jgi:hypothetical protein
MNAPPGKFRRGGPLARDTVRTLLTRNSKLDNEHDNENEHDYGSKAMNENRGLTLGLECRFLRVWTWATEPILPFQLRKRISPGGESKFPFMFLLYHKSTNFCISLHDKTL